MPTRMLREGILDSEAVNLLSAEAEVFYRRLMSVVDDYGRFDGRTKVLRARLYPLRGDTVSEENITKWLNETVVVGLVVAYEVNGKPFVQMHRLGVPRAKDSKYPAPPEQACQSIRLQTKTDENTPNSQMNTDVNGCSQVNTGAPYSYSISDSYSRPTSGSGAEVGQVAKPAGYDPLRESEKNRKDFEAAWNAAKLRPLKRLSHTLHSRLDALLLNNVWAETWREALVRVGKIPFFATGAGRRNGPLDPSEFLDGDEFVAAVIRGKYDQHSRDGPVQPVAPTVFTDPDNLATNRTAPPMPKPKGAAA